MRRHVAPADPGATIPDPERGDALPPEGRTVAWSAHWATMAARSDVTVGEPQDEVAEPEAPKAPPESSAPAKPSKTPAA